MCYFYSVINKKERTFQKNIQTDGPEVSSNEIKYDTAQREQLK